MSIKYQDKRTDFRFTHPIETVEWLSKEEGIRDKRGRDKRGSYGWTMNQGGYNTERQSWTGDACWADMIDMAQTGWTAGTTDIINQIDQIEHVQDEELSGYRFDVTGQFFDVGLVVSGEPECWFEQEMEPTRKVVSICSNISSSGGIEAGTLARRGAAIIALVDQLQTAGYIVELTAVAGLSNGEKTMFVWWEFGCTPLDIDAAALVLAHPGWFRIVGHNLAQCGNNDCYGNYCQELDREERRKYTLYFDSGDLRTESGRYLNNSADAAQWVNAQIKKIGEMEL